jgi:transcriptional regulator with XRE-family HTH domain
VAKREVHDVLLAFGGKVRRLRKQKKLSQRYLAEKADMSTKRLGELERGVSDAGIMRLIKLAEALGVPAFSLLAPDDALPARANPALVERYQIAREAFGALGQTLGVVPQTPADREAGYERPKRARSKRKKS